MNELIIEQKVRDMILYGYIALRQLPRAERHVLSAEIRTSMLKLLKLVITAAKRHHKKTTLTDMDVELAALQAGNRKLDSTRQTCKHISTEKIIIQMRVKPRPLGRGYKRSKFS